MEKSVGRHYKCPKNYVWLKKGDPYMTRHCREITLAAGRTLFAVQDAKNRPLGLYVPEQIFEEVKAADALTKNKREAATKKKDALTLEKARLALHELFPAIPKKDEEAVLTRAWKKNSRRVGRTEKISMEVKVKLGVTAHVRHTYTEYEKLLKKGFTRDAARKSIEKDVESIVSKWQGLVGRCSPEIIDLEESDSDYLLPGGSDSSVEIIAAKTVKSKKTATKKMSETLTTEKTATEKSIRKGPRSKSTIAKPRSKKAATPAKRAGKVVVPRKAKSTKGASPGPKRGGKGGKK
ncbi:hypothetical protein HDK77DRAFT_163801 [Phyllosticta capitalensis]